MQQQSQFYLALERALHNYLKAKLNLETQEFSKLKINSVLAERRVSEKTCHAFVTLLENCEQARYAPGSLVNMNEDFKDASSIIAILDKELK